MVLGTKISSQKSLSKHNQITYIIIDRPLEDLIDAKEIAHSIRLASEPTDDRQEGHLRIGKTNVGYWLTTTTGLDRPWSYVGVKNLHLIKLAQELAEENRLTPLDGQDSIAIPMTTIGQIFDAGPTHHLIGHLPGYSRIGVFEMQAINDQTVHKTTSLWGLQY